MKKFLAFLAVLATALLLASCGGGGGSAGETAPSTKLRMTPLLDSAGLPVGTFADFARISDGVPPYYVSTTDGAASPVLMTVNGKTNTLRIYGNAPTPTDKPATISVSDSSATQTKISFTVTVSSSAVYIDPPVTDLTLGAGASFAFTVHGGLPPYLVDGTMLGTSPLSSDGAFGARCVNPVGDFCPYHQYVIEANGAEGSGSIIITDQYRSTYTIKVTSKAAPAMAVAPTSLAGKEGTTAQAMIIGGYSPYRVISSNPGVATATVSGSTVTVTFVSEGTAEISVVDATGATASIGVTVVSDTPPLTVSPVSKTLGNPTGTGAPTVTFTIAGGKDPYSPAVGPGGAGYITASVTGSTLTVVRDTTCLAAGAPDKPVTVTVTDGKGQTSTVSVVLQYNATALCP